MEAQVTTSRPRPVRVESPRESIAKTAHQIAAFWWVFVLLPSVGALSTYYAEREEVPLYRTEADLLMVFAPKDPFLGVKSASLNNQLARVYRRQIRTLAFLRTVVATHPDLGRTSGQMRMALRTRVLLEPTILQIDVTDPDPQVAAEVADAVAKGFVRFTTNSNIQEIANLRSSAAEVGLDEFDQFIAENLQTITTVQLMEPVLIPEEPIPSKRRRNTTLAIIGGLAAAGMIFLFVREGMSRIGTELDLQDWFGLTPLGRLPKWSKDDVKGHDIVTLTHPSSEYSEAFRSIRANLHFATASSHAQRILVTSPRPSDGKSTVASNLAVVMAQSGRQVVLIDGDLRRPSLRHHFGLPSDGVGLTNFLADETMTRPDGVLHGTDVKGIKVIPSGPIPPNPAELLDSPRMGILLDLLLVDHDIVVIDSPPILILSDSSILASKVDGTVLVVDGSNTSLREVKASVDQIRRAGSQVLGGIVTKMKVSRLPFRRPYHYGYEYTEDAVIG